MSKGFKVKTAKGKRKTRKRKSKKENIEITREFIEEVNKNYPLDKIVPYMGNPSLPSHKSQVEYDEDRMKIILKCKEDIVFFAENFFHIVNLDHGQQLIQLYDYQKEALRVFATHNKCILNTSRQAGKALALDTPIPTPNGWTTMGAIKDSDILFDNNGNYTKVIKAWDVMYDRPCYEITFDNGEKIIADEDHLWLTETFNERRNRKSKNNIRKRTTKEILDTLHYKNGKRYQSNHAIRLAEPIAVGNEVNLPVHPYLLGLWLGSDCGCESTLRVFKKDICNIKEVLNEIGFKDGVNYNYNHSKGEDVIIHLNLVDVGNGATMLEVIRDLGVRRNKHIPTHYLRASLEDRKFLLQGLMDSGNSTSGRTNSFYSSNQVLIRDFRELLMTLGIKYNVEDLFKRGLYKIKFKAKFDVFKLVRKVEKQGVIHSSRDNYIYIRDIKPVKSIPVRCITVDSPDGLFLGGRSGIVCSNTSLMTIYALWLCSFFKHQRIVIVANMEATAQEILKRIKLAYEELPNWFKPSIKNWGKQQVEFTSDCSIQISATSESSIRGKSVSCLIVDEMSHVDPGIINAFWAAVYPTISSSKKAKALIASTPNGVGNKFHELWENSQLPESEWGSVKVTWDHIPGRTDGWAKQQKIDLGEDLFEQEYNCVFLESGEGFISEELRKTLLELCYKPRYELYDGDYQIYREPDIENRFYAAGVDVGDGVGKAASTINIIDITDLYSIEQVATYHSNDVGVYDFSTRLNDIMKHWGKPPLAIERNQMGSSVITQMDKSFNYPNLVNFSQRQGNISYDHLKGVTSSTNTKHAGITNLFYWLKAKEVIVLHDVEYLNEFKTFIRGKNNTWGKRRGDNIWDDRVIALMWSLIVLHEDIVDKFYTVLQYDGNKRPQEIKPIYVNHDNSDSLYQFGNENNNWGVGDPYIPNTMWNDDPYIQNYVEQGWMLPNSETDLDYIGSWTHSTL